jgi:hypothetical protein
VLPLGVGLPTEFVKHLQLQHLVVDLSHPVLRGVLKGKAGADVLVVGAVIVEAERGKVTLHESAVGVAKNGGGSGVVDDGVGVVGVELSGKEGESQKGGRVAAEADGAVSGAELEDEQADEQGRAHPIEFFIIRVEDE